MARSLTRAGPSPGINPYVGCVEVGEEIGSLVRVNGGKGCTLVDALGLQPFVGVRPRGANGGEVSNLELDEGVGKKDQGVEPGLTCRRFYSILSK